MVIESQAPVGISLTQSYFHTHKCLLYLTKSHTTICFIRDVCAVHVEIAFFFSADAVSSTWTVKLIRRTAIYANSTLWNVNFTAKTSHCIYVTVVNPSCQISKVVSLFRSDKRKPWHQHTYKYNVQRAVTQDSNDMPILSRRTATTRYQV